MTDQETYRRVLEWGCDRMLAAENLEQAKQVWDSFPVLWGDWVFVGIKNKVKNQLIEKK